MPFPSFRLDIVVRTHPTPVPTQKGFPGSCGAIGACKTPLNARPVPPSNSKISPYFVDAPNLYQDRYRKQQSQDHDLITECFVPNFACLRAK
jgi:hypothetical protein